jgi:hypothetical protein
MKDHAYDFVVARARAAAEHARYQKADPFTDPAAGLLAWCRSALADAIQSHPGPLIPSGLSDGDWEAVAQATAAAITARAR